MAGLTPAPGGDPEVQGQEVPRRLRLPRAQGRGGSPCPLFFFPPLPLSSSPPLMLFSPLPELRGEVGPLFSSSSLLLFTPLAQLMGDVGLLTLALLFILSLLSSPRIPKFD